MFKRIEKRRRKKEEEDELGLDENAKEILGMHDTDSDESDSDASNHEPVPKVVEDADQEEVSDEEDDRPPISVSDALRSPIYVVSIALDVKSCVVCPGKFLKNSRMVAVHEASEAHKRRFKRFVSAARLSDAEDDAFEIAVKSEASQGTKPEHGTSKRQAKRQARDAAMKRKRDLHKAAKAKARARGTEDNHSRVIKEPVESDDPSRKKRRREKRLSPDQSKSNMTTANAFGSQAGTKSERKVRIPTK